MPGRLGQTVGELDGRELLQGAVQALEGLLHLPVGDDQLKVDVRVAVGAPAGVAAAEPGGPGLGPALEAPLQLRDDRVAGEVLGHAPGLRSLGLPGNAEGAC